MTSVHDKWNCKQIITQFMEQGVNTALYYKNKSLSDTFSIVPTSAIRYKFFPPQMIIDRAEKCSAKF